MTPHDDWMARIKGNASTFSHIESSCVECGTGTGGFLRRRCDQCEVAARSRRLGQTFLADPARFAQIVDSWPSGQL